MRPSPASSKAHTSFAAAITEGVRFIYGHSVLRWIYLMLLVTALSVPLSDRISSTMPASSRR